MLDVWLSLQMWHRWDRHKQTEISNSVALAAVAFEQGEHLESIWPSSPQTQFGLADVYSTAPITGTTNQRPAPSACTWASGEILRPAREGKSEKVFRLMN